MPFAGDAIAAVAIASCGVPRIVNAICSNALACAYAAKESLVRLRHIRQVTRDLDILPPASASGGSLVVTRVDNPGAIALWRPQNVIEPRLPKPPFAMRLARAFGLGSIQIRRTSL
jgi:hypothetical protein